MSSCLSGGGRTYQFDLEIINKSRWVSASRASSPPSSSSSPASTLSESSNYPISISTRRTRTPRKRPNQIYNEAAALLSTVYPNIFSAKHLENPRKFANFEGYFSDESSDLLLPLPGFEAASFLLRQPIPAKSDPRIEPKCSPRFPENQCGNNESISKSPQLDDEFDDDDDEFDAESILDEETGEGIDSILGDLSASAAASDEAEATASHGIPVGLGFGTRRGIRPLKRVGEASWWNFSTVEVVEISPKLNSRASDSNPAEKKNNNNKKKAAKTPPEPKTPSTSAAAAAAAAERPKSGGLMLKLNYDGVSDAWSRRGRPLSGESPVPDAAPAGLADFDSFAMNGTEREGTGSRYKEKRPVRPFSKKVEYQVKKAHANERPRVKGRFVRRPDSGGSEPKQ